MKILSMMVVFVLWLVMDSWAGCVYKTTVRNYNYQEGASTPFIMLYECVADGINTISDFSIDRPGGMFVGVNVKRDGTLPPESVTVTVNNFWGLPIFTSTAITNAATGSQNADTPRLLVNYDALKPSVSQTITAPAGDKWEVGLEFF